MIFSHFFWEWKSYHKYEEVEKSDFFPGKDTKDRYGKHIFNLQHPPKCHPPAREDSGLRSGIMVATIIPECSLLGGSSQLVSG